MSDPMDIHPAAPAEEVDALYGLPPREFTPARNALARRLRSAGEREAATWVTGLKRPTTAAWAVNQLARTQRDAARELHELAGELAELQRQVLAGEADADHLGEASGRERELVTGLARTAEGLLDHEGRPPSVATLERVRETLHAVALDPGVRAAFAEGRLTREARAAGLGGLIALDAVPAGGGRGDAGRARRAGAGAAPRGHSADERRRQRQARKEELAAAREEMRAAARALKTARRAADRAQRETDRLEAEARDAAEKHERAQARVRALEDR